MKKNKTFRALVSFFSRKNIKNKLEKVDQTVHELIHPRFIMDKSSETTNKSTKKSMLFHLYSNENDTLFI
ncbi:hypothetical protein ACSVH5_05265 [Flavobacterium sp. RSSA_27]|uniref:hypothetical protein n=1 Tax=Flavobacterium sp. RSSA_27 TaxID=3447667 RepID=UPI003F33869F